MPTLSQTLPATHQTLAHATLTRWRVNAHSPTTRMVVLVCAALFIAASAQAAVPLWPVPITMQTFAVLLVGAALGWKGAIGATALYLAMGAVGLPVFAHATGGAARLVGPSGGFLFAFVLGAALVGMLAERGWDRTFGRTLAAMAMGNLLILCIGAAWLAAFFPSDFTFVGGFAIFLPGAALKTALAAAALPIAWRLLGAGRAE